MSRSDVTIGRLSRYPPELGGWAGTGPLQSGSFWRGITLAQEGQRDEARAALDHAYQVGDNWRELLRRMKFVLPSDPAVRYELVET